tara:strand:- start:236 stop:358 length:123 start_codon:yes stop_codon:yes gene_type:complete
VVVLVEEALTLALVEMVVLVEVEHKVHLQEGQAVLEILLQ